MLLTLASGPLILGHAPPKVIEAVKEQLHRGTTFFAGTELMIEVAKLAKLVLGVERVLEKINETF